MILIDMTGKKYQRLTVIKRDPKDSKKWLCMCDCGNTKSVCGYSLRNNGFNSCGCYRSEVSKKQMTKHGYCKTSINNIYLTMIARCTNKNTPSYHNYGGRGIDVCQR